MADYISMSRPFIRDPSIVNRWKAGDLHVAECISCNNCFEQIKQGMGVSCVPLEAEPVEKFFSQKSKTIPASQPHPPGTEYQISMGLEQWGVSFIPVIKIELIYEGKTVDRDPSFPLGSDDPSKVAETISELAAEFAAGTPQE